METALQNRTIHKGRISDQIKTILKQAILDGHFKPGDKFPPEIEIAQQYNVSKVSAREALRGMEAEGLILKKRGIFGGSFVAEPGSEKMADAVNNSYLFGGITATDLSEFRRVLEPQLIRLAAERRTDEDLSAMEHCLEEIEACIREGQPDQTTAIHFHCLIANACHNPFISSLMAAMVSVFQKVLAKTPEYGNAVKDFEYNRRFFECIRQRDGEGGALVMKEHFDTLDELIKENMSRTDKQE